MARTKTHGSYSFSTWLQAVGDKTASRMFGAKERTVRSWRLKERVPGQRMTCHIIDTTGGSVTWEMIHRRGKP